MHAIRRAVVVGALLAPWAFVGQLHAQDQLITKELEDQFGKSYFQFREKVIAGTQGSTPAELELASRFFVLRVTQLQAQVEPKVMGGITKEFENLANNAVTHAKKNDKIRADFAPHLINRFKEVFALNFLPNRVAVINAAVMLPQLARFRQDDIGDYLANVVADEKLNNAIRMYAAKGLREYMPALPFTKTELNQGAKTKQLEERKKRDVNRVNALLKFIDWIDNAKKSAKDAEEIDALRYMRTEAVATLALSGVPAVCAINGTAEGPVALGLIKVLANKVQLSPATRERVEAAIGVCYFTKYIEEYDPKIGIFLVGDCLSEFFSEYKKDYANVRLGLKDKDRKPTYLAFKHEAKRLEAGLTELVSNTRGTPNANAASTIESMAKPMLQQIFNNQAIERDVEFREALKKLMPNTKVLFKTKGKPLEFELESAGAADDK